MIEVHPTHQLLEDARNLRAMSYSMRNNMLYRAADAIEELVDKRNNGGRVWFIVIVEALAIAILLAVRIPA